MSRKITWSESQVFEVSVWLNWGDIPLISRGRMKRIAWITFVFPFIINSFFTICAFVYGWNENVFWQTENTNFIHSMVLLCCCCLFSCAYNIYFFLFRFRRWVVLHLNKGILVGWMWIIKNWDNTHRVRSKLPKRAARKLLKTTHTHIL